MFSGGPIDLSVSQEMISGTQAALATINLNGPASTAVSVYYEMLGSAESYTVSLVSPSDVTTTEWSGQVGVVNIPLGESSATVTIQDPNAWGSESATFALFGVSGGTYEIDSASSAAAITLGGDGSSASSGSQPVLSVYGNSKATVTIDVSGANSSQSLAVGYWVSGPNDDYELSVVPYNGSSYTLSGSGGTLTLPAGVSLATVTILDPSYVSGSESVTFGLNSASDGSYDVDSNGAAATATLGDSGSGSGSSGGDPVISISGSGPTVTIEASSTADQDMAIAYSLSGPANEYWLTVVPNSGTSYLLSDSSGTFTLPAGASEATIAIVDPSNVSASESLTLTLGSFSGASYELDSASSIAAVTIGNEPVLDINGGTGGTFTISAADALQQSVTVDYSLTGSNSDYELFVVPNSGASFSQYDNGTIPLPAGASQATVTIVDPDNTSGSENVTVALALDSEVSYVLDSASTVVNITGNGGSASSSGQQVITASSSDGATITVDITGSSSEPTSVGFSLSGSLQVYGVLEYDQSGLLSAQMVDGSGATLTVPAGDNQVTVDIVDLGNPSDSAGVGFALTSVSGPAVIDSNASALTADLDAIAPSASAPSVSIQASGATVTIELSQPASQGLTVDYSLSGSASEYLVDAVFGAGYQVEQWDSNYATITFPAGATQAALQVADPSGASASGSEAVTLELLAPSDNSYSVSNNASMSAVTISVEGGAGLIGNPGTAIEGGILPMNSSTTLAGPLTVDNGTLEVDGTPPSVPALAGANIFMTDSSTDGGGASEGTYGGHLMIALPTSLGPLSMNGVAVNDDGDFSAAELNVGQQGAAIATDNGSTAFNGPLTLSGPLTLTNSGELDLSAGTFTCQPTSTSSTQIVTTGTAVVSGAIAVDIASNSSSLSAGSYTLISATDGISFNSGGAFVFSNGTTSQIMTVGAVMSAATLLTTPTTVTLVVTPLAWTINSTGDSPAANPALSPATGNVNLLDQPEVTLRSEIEFLNDHNGGSAVFAIPPNYLPNPNQPVNAANNFYTITVSGTPLPALATPIYLLGSFETGYQGNPVIDVAGSYGGFTISAPDSIIDTLAVTGASGAGILINSATGGDTVSNSYVGVLPGGATASGNAGYGIEINGSPNDVISNDTISANTFGGIHTTGEGAQHNTIISDFIGTNASGTASVGTQGVGILIDNGAQSNFIGTATGWNVISGNQGDGIELKGNTDDGNTVQMNTLQYNYIGTNRSGLSGIGNTGNGVEITGWAHSNYVGGGVGVSPNVICNNALSGVLIDGYETSFNTVQGNYIGITPSGSRLGNTDDGVTLQNGASSNTIGSDGSSGEANAIGANGWNGVHITSSASNNIVAGNFIGTNSSGTNLGNTQDGVEIEYSATLNLIGSDGAGTANQLALKMNTIGFNRYGVRIDGTGTADNVVAGDYIGTNNSGDDLGNTQDGVLIADGASRNWIGVNNEIGTESEAQRNYIDCNRGDGVRISAADQNFVAGNYIGAQSVATTHLGNNGDGVRIENGASSNTIGSLLSAAAVDTIMANTIAWNGPSPATGETGAGVAVVSPDIFTNTTGNSILGNSIFGNIGIGIDLGDDGPTANDSASPSHPNENQNYPVITGIIPGNDSTTIRGKLQSNANTTYRIEIYSNNNNSNWYEQGTNLLTDQNLLSDIYVTTDSNGNAQFVAIVAGSPQNITTTATAPDGSTSEFGSFGLDLLADTNRDNQFTAADEAGKSTWTAGSGAIILDNSNLTSVSDQPAYTNVDGTAFGAISSPVPQNWQGGDYGKSVALGEVYQPPDNVINDASEVGMLRLNQLNTNSLPSNLTITLTVTNPALAGSYYVTASPDSLVRIFLPTSVSPFGDGDYVRTAGDEGIIYPYMIPGGGDIGTNTATFVSSPASGTKQLSDSLFKGDGSIYFGIEGIAPGALADIKVTLSVGAVQFASDMVEVKVSPFILSDNTQDVATGTAGHPTVFVSGPITGTDGNTNQLLIDKLKTLFPGQVDSGQSNDVWLQDGVEIGYTQAPYGQLPIVLETPRAQALYNRTTIQAYVETTMAQTNVGIYTGLLTGTFTENQDDGGNIEALPNPTGGPDFLFYGNQMSPNEVNFFVAQGANPLLGVNTDWLSVGHVDEVVSLASDGQHIDVADPELAYGLLLWAQAVENPAAPVTMLQGMNIGDTVNGVAIGAAGVTLDNVLADATLRDFNLDADNSSSVMFPGNLPSIIDTVAAATNSTMNTWAVTPSDGNTGNIGVLTKAMAYTAFLSGTRLYQVRFIPDPDNPQGTGATTEYELWYSDDSGTTWKASLLPNGQPQVGEVGDDAVFQDAKAFILKEWWNTSGGLPDAGDVIQFSANPNTDIVQIPVLFKNVLGVSGIPTGEATAFTSDNVNALVNGPFIVTAATYGPVVDYDNSGVSSDILQDYCTYAFEDSGYSPFPNYINFVDSRYYHNLEGNIHCATNVIRQLPNSQWWSN